MKKFFKEFKAFINKGSVMDLAVGLIIGSAFTAIVTALVTQILTPLINWIPGSQGTSALKSVLRNPVVDAQGNIITQAVVLDWGAVISAIITFVLTAFVLFLIIKALNKIKVAGAKVKTTINEDIIKLYKKDDGISENATVEVKAETEIAEPIVAPTTQTTEDLLKEIIELLKGNK